MSNTINTEKANILIVDDTPANLQVLVSMLHVQGYRIRPVPSGKLALQAAEQEPPDLILLDIMMPEMDGFEVCRQLKSKEKLKGIPIIFISALNQTIEKVEAFNVGGVDYITKPFYYEEVQARVSNHLKLRELQLELERQNNNLKEIVEEQVKDIWDSQMATIFALAKLSESRDNDTGRHIERVQAFCKRLVVKLASNKKYSNKITQSFIDNIYHASALHDIGKVAIPDNILLKPAKLTKEEFEVMKTHTTLGAHTLEEVYGKYSHNEFIKTGIDIARFHHEKWDGSGYPLGLVADEIPLASRIMALADVYDALRSKRCYKAGISHTDSVNIINESSGSHFDPGLVEAFNILHNEFNDIWNQME